MLDLKNDIKKREMTKPRKNTFPTEKMIFKTSFKSLLFLLLRYLSFNLFLLKFTMLFILFLIAAAMFISHMFFIFFFTKLALVTGHPVKIPSHPKNIFLKRASMSSLFFYSGARIPFSTVATMYAHFF